MKTEGFNRKVALLIGLAVLSAVALFLMGPIPQDPQYHLFVDGREWLGIPNFLNVFSNLPFALVGIAGFILVGKSHGKISKHQVEISAVFFLGVFCTAFGSGFYHLNPNNQTLFFDRLPMTELFASLFALVIMKRIHEKAGFILFFPLFFLGAFSLWYWHAGEEKGQGDLRIYAFVQYYSMVAIPLIILLFRNEHASQAQNFLVAGGLYLLAKVFEHFDAAIFSLGHIVSGHTLKHLAAGLATYFIYRALKQDVESAPIQKN